MDFVTAVKTCLGKYATFQGRAIRSEFWFFSLFYFILSLITQVIASASDGALAVLPAVLMIAMFVPSLAVTVRRLHDLDKSGWWYLLALIPLIGIIVLLVWSCKRGTVGPNRFGEDGLAAQADPASAAA